MTAQAKIEQQGITPLPGYQSILLAVDSSDHANQGLREAVRLAENWNSQITGTHVYAAKLHDLRFRQMEGGLPEQFRDEDELERQRDVHDDLITRGLSIITDSYLDQADEICQIANINFKRRSLEGKNYRELVKETNSGDYDLLIMGAVGLGAVQDSRLGTVCQRVARRADIDTLIIKEPNRRISDGPIVVAIDGSAKAYGGLLTAFALAQQHGTKIKVIAAFDPYYHYVAFNRIADVLSEEAGKVFKFKEQEKLHEEIIDSGLAKIYQGHLDVAQSIADDYEIKIETVLLDGKPYDAINKYLHKINPSLLVLGKVGIHADADLDIGGVSEHLLHDADCAVLLSQREHQPRIDMVADVTTSWTNEAEERMKKVPSFVRNMARMAILRYAQEKGHTVITAKIVEEATAQLMPGHAEQAMGEIVAAHDAGQLKRKPEVKDVMRWSGEATTLLRSIDDMSLRGNLSMRAEKKARGEKSSSVELEHIKAFIEEEPPAMQNTATNDSTPNMHWQAAALARLMRVPEGFMRDASKQHIEDYAQRQGASDISLDIAEAGLAEARKAMESSMNSPHSHGQPGEMTSAAPEADTENVSNENITWTAAADARMEKIPEGFMRDLTRQRVEVFAKRHGVSEVTAELVAEKYSEWGAGSAKQTMTLNWDDAALERVSRIPDFVRGMVIKEVERCASEQGTTSVTVEILSAAVSRWEGMEAFHSEANPDLYK